MDNYTDLNLQSDKPISISAQPGDADSTNHRPSWDDSDDDGKKKTGWASMNDIQRGGVIICGIFMLPSWIYSGTLGNIFGMICWSALLLGYVAGNLWKVRHALHFWWSVAFACIVHSFLLPTYANLTTHMRDFHGSTGKAYMYVAFGLVIAETLTLIFVLKKFAMWLRKRVHMGPQGQMRRDF